VDLKQQDAIKVLETLLRSDRTRKVDFELQHTVFLEQLIDRDQIVGTVDGVSITAEMLVNHARLECENYLSIQDRAIADTLILETARQLGISVTDSERRQGLARFKRSLGLVTNYDIATWTRRHHMSEDEFQTLIEEWLLIEKTKMHYLKPSNRAIVRQFRLNGDYETLLAGAASKEEAARHAPRQHRDLLDKSWLYAYYAERGQLDDPQDIRAHAARLGFADEKSLLFELERYFLYHADKGDSGLLDEPNDGGAV
jgi:hypothetical protein